MKNKPFSLLTGWRGTSLNLVFGVSPDLHMTINFNHQLDSKVLLQDLLNWDGDSSFHSLPCKVQVTL